MILHHQKLMEKFEEFSIEDGFMLGRVSFDEIELANYGTVFLRGDQCRTFSVDLNIDHDRGHEAFFSMVGELKNIKCLNILIPHTVIKYREIWDMYVSWLVQKLSEEEMRFQLVQFDDGKY